jgi:hypothetical protein
MASQEKWAKIQAIIGTQQDSIPGPKDDAALAKLREEALAEHKASKAPGVHSVLASSFADDADVMRFNRCKAKGGSDQECFAVGDNGVGCFGDNTNTAGPMCALPPEDMEEKWGSVSAAKHKLVLVKSNGRSVVCVLGDRMPRRAAIKNGAGVDLNPAACKALGFSPPLMIKATWEWA